ncbi:MAG: FHA domain-containing protein [Congregibacter sp.]
MEVVLEVLGTTNNVLERKRFSRERVRIGRGYGCDLIVDDEHTDVEHAELNIDDQGQPWIVDLGSVNGIKRAKSRGRVQRVPVSSGDVFVIGRNKVRVLLHDHTLPPAVPIRPVESFLLWLGRPPVLVVLLLTYVAIAFASAYYSTSGEFKWSTFFGNNVFGALQFVGLAAGVYLLSVLFRRSGNFPSHLSVLLSVAVFSSLSSFLIKLARFNAGDSSYGILSVLESVNGYAIVFMYLWSVLYLAFNFSMLRRTVVSASCVVLIVFSTVIQQQAIAEFGLSKTRPPLAREFLPPAFQLVTPTAPDDYVSKTNGLFDAVDETRQKLLEARGDS